MPQKSEFKGSKNEPVVLSASLSGLVWSKPGCLELSPGYAALPLPCSGSACLGLGVLFYSDRFIYDLSRVWSNQRRQREMERQWNDGGAFLCTEDQHTFEHKHTDGSPMISPQKVWVWDVFPLKRWFSHLPKSIFQRPMIPPVTHPVFTFINSLSEMIFARGTWSIPHQKFDFVVFPNIT